MLTHIVRASLSLASILAAVGMVAVAINAQSHPALAQTIPDCEDNGESFCQEGEACCSGTCYDPQYYICDCTGTLVPRDEYEGEEI